MSGINKCILVGNMGREIEVKSVANGVMGKFSLATSKKIKDEERTVWHNVVVWDEKKVEYLQKWSKTGTKLYLEGEIDNRSYEADGVKKYISEIVIGRFDSKVQILAGGRNEKDAQYNAQSAGAPNTPTQDAGPDDEIPW